MNPKLTISGVKINHYLNQLNKKNKERKKKFICK